LKVGQTALVQIHSDDSVPYSAYAGFDNGTDPLGTLSEAVIFASAGNLASLSPLSPPPLYGYYVNAAGASPAPSAGVHFCFTYTPASIGQTVLKLYDSTLSTVLDSLTITVEPAQTGTGFTYQGRLLDDNNAAEGLYDFVFKLFDAPSQGSSAGDPIVMEDVEVLDGYFTVRLDFGDVFGGEGRWLETSVRAGELEDPDAYALLSPRQAVTAAPIALYALNSDTTGMITGVTAGAGLTGGGTSGDITLSVAAPLALSASGTSGTISATATGGSGRGVYGNASYSGHLATNYGGYFEAEGTYGRGVYGSASGSEGRGVYGFADNRGDYQNYGGTLKRQAPLAGVFMELPAVPPIPSPMAGTSKRPANKDGASMGMPPLLQPRPTTAGILVRQVNKGEAFMVLPATPVISPTMADTLKRWANWAAAFMDMPQAARAGVSMDMPATAAITKTTAGILKRQATLAAGSMGMPAMPSVPSTMADTSRRQVPMVSASMVVPATPETISTTAVTFRRKADMATGSFVL
jgi:hypothetical protein